MSGKARDCNPFTASLNVRKLSDGAIREAEDYVAVEAPLEVWVGGSPMTIMMRTPGHDEELVRGFLFNEGMIASARDVVSISPVEMASDSTHAVNGSVVAVELATAAAPKTERTFYSNSSCGVCGKQTIEALEVRGAPLESGLRIDRRVLATLPDRLRAVQDTFAQTGGVHASGLFNPNGELVVIREDVGRHNAFDKITGWALGAGRIPLADCVLLLSGRVSYELIQKAVAAGIPLIAAVGAPSSLAVAIADRFHITLAGFLRPNSMNIYTHPERIVG
jgi:FdhD protein